MEKIKEILSKNDIKIIKNNQILLLDLILHIEKVSENKVYVRREDDFNIEFKTLKDLKEVLNNNDYHLHFIEEE